MIFRMTSEPIGTIVFSVAVQLATMLGMAAHALFVAKVSP
jgi:hypothetical protein